ncbi:substrate-binding periplasmic protein [Candidatus Phytoplasma asteris]|uniref:ABC-type amino acid transport system, substrate-binding protein n=1 Tax=Candidatus Phytoplasma asteris TaxID=85620 RepID=A0ABZ3CDV5_9MOLU
MFGWFKKEKINQEQRQSESNISEKTTTNNKDESILKVGVMNNVAPNVFKVLETHKDTIKSQNTGEYVAGFDIDLIKEIAENLELKLEIYVFDFKGILGALNQNKIDLSITSMSITEERAKTLDVSKAYTQTETSMVVRKSDKRFDDLRKTKEIDYDSFCDKLKDLGREKPISFITFQNTTAIPIIDKIQKQVNEDQIIRIKKDNELDSHTACFQNIKLKKSDIFIIDSYLAMVACKINDDLDYFYMTSNNLENSACTQGLGIFFPKEEKNDEDRRIPNLKKSINESLVKLNLVKKDDKGKFQDIIDLKKTT